MQKTGAGLAVWVLAMLLAEPAWADDGAMQRCMGIADSLKRLDCFEKLARSRAGETGSPQPGEEADSTSRVIEAPAHPLKTRSSSTTPMTQVVPGKSEIERWLIHVSVDPVNGGAQVVLRNKAVKGRNQFAVPVELRLECKAGRPSAFVLWREPMVKGEVPVLLFDGRNVGAASENWRMDDKSENWVYTGHFAQLLEALATHQEASGSVQVMDENINFEDDIINAWFNITGAEYALKPLKKACF